MTKKTLKSIALPIIVLAVITMFMSSCAVGYGCPSASHGRTHVRR